MPRKRVLNKNEYYRTAIIASIGRSVLCKCRIRTPNERVKTSILGKTRRRTHSAPERGKTQRETTRTQYYHNDLPTYDARVRSIKYMCIHTYSFDYGNFVVLETLLLITDVGPSSTTDSLSVLGWK